MFKKTLKTQNKKAKLLMITLFIFGVALLFVSGSVPLKPLWQILGFVSVAAAVYIATVFVLKEYTVSIFFPEGSSVPDFAIYEFRSNREIKVCHISISDIREIKVITPENAKAEKEKRKGLKSYRYNTFFDCKEFIEIITDEDISITVTYDEELYKALKTYI